MLFFGLVWVTSWIGYFFSFSHGLPPSLDSKGSPTKVSNNVTKLVNKHRPLFVTQKQQIDTTNQRLAYANLTNLSWQPRQAYVTQINPGHSEQITSTIASLSKNQNLMCSPNQGTTAATVAVKSINIAPVGRLVEPLPAAHNFLPHRILRSLSSFFRIPQSQDQALRTVSTPVVIVHRDKAKFEIWLNNNLIATLPSRVQANLMQQSLTQLVKNPSLDASQLRPGLLDKMPAIMLGNRYLFVIDKEISTQLQRSGDLLAIDWINNLRTAFKVPTLSLIEAQEQLYGLMPSNENFSGLASWYGDGFHGRLTATGEIYDQDELTVAHKHLPFNTYLRVTNLETGNQVILRVNDRGPYIEPRTLDLSRAAARCLGSEQKGVVEYQAVIMRSNPASLQVDGRKLSYAQNLAASTDFR